MDMEFGPDGAFYLLTYGDGFFNINPDAGMMRWDYVKGQRAPVAVLTADTTDGPAPLTVNFSSAGSNDADQGDSIRFEWDFDGNGTVDSVEPNPTFTYTTPGQYTAKLDGDRLERQDRLGEHHDHGRQHRPDGHGQHAGRGRDVRVRRQHPVHGHGHRSGGRADQLLRVEVTFVLGHDTHGHAEASTTGCTGVLPTLAEDVSHGGNVFGVISASYTDLGGGGGVPALTTVDQNQIRQKRQEVENVAQPERHERGDLDRRRRRLPARQPQRGRLDRAQRPVQPAEHRLDHVPGDGRHRRRGRPARSRSGAMRSTPPAAARSCRARRSPGRRPGRTRARRSRSSNPGGTHRLFLVFANANTYSLNWVEFVGAGVGT